MIIDPHVHLGHDTTFDSNRTEDEIINTMDEVGIGASILQPAQYMTLADFKTCHTRIYDFSLKHPGRIFGLFASSPHYDEDLYRAEAQRCVKKLGFVGIKICPHTHVYNPLCRRAYLPFEVARELRVPLLCHTGNGLPFASPSNFYHLIKEYKDVDVVLAHAGTTDTTDEIITLARKFDNVYIETSTREPNQHNLRSFLKAVGSQKMMYASDSTTEMKHCVWVIRRMGLTEEDEENILWKTADRVFQLGKAS